MRWDVKKVEIKVLGVTIVPVRLKLIRENGTVVTSADYTIADAAVTLFSTAGLGRHSPRALADIASKKFGDRSTENWVTKLIDGLLSTSFSCPSEFSKGVI